MQSARRGDVLVIDNGGRLDEGCIGDLTALEAEHCGLAGIIVWGAHRGNQYRLGQDVHRHTATLGYWLAEDFWRRCIMTEAVAAFTDLCSQNFPLCRISAQVFANNPASAMRVRENRFCFRRTPQERRRQRQRSSRFVAVRPNEVAARPPAVCLFGDHRRYGSL